MSQQHDTPTAPPKPANGNTASERDSFAQAADEAEPGLIREFIDFLAHNKKWWMLPIVLVLLLMGLIIIGAQTGAAPFLYTTW
jgi:hypothetical protein